MSEYDAPTRRRILLLGLTLAGVSGYAARTLTAERTYVPGGRPLDAYWAEVCAPGMPWPCPPTATSRFLEAERARLSQPDTDTPGPTGLAHLTEEAP